MANQRDGKDNTLQKASSLAGDGLSPLSRSMSGSGKRAGGVRERSVSGKKRFSWKSLVVDLLLILLVSGIGVGAFFGYRAVKNAYMPAWETKSIEFCVKIPDMESERGNLLVTVLEGKNFWLSAEADGACLGVISQAAYDPGAEEDEINLILTVRTTAQYRKGEGYYVGSTRILAGETGKFRSEGFVGEGVVMYVRDVSEVSS